MRTFFVFVLAALLSPLARALDLVAPVSMTVTGSTVPVVGGVPLGMNLGSVNYYGESDPFVDLMKGGGDWFTQPSTGGVWNSNVMGQIALDADRYPLQLPYVVNGTSEAVIMPTEQPLYAGDYAFLYAGTGVFQFVASSVSVVSKSPGRWVVRISSGAGTAVWLKIFQSDVNDHLRDLHLVPLAQESTYQSQPFNAKYLALLSGMSVLRFMDWGMTNGSFLSTWAQRVTPAQFQGGGRGVGYEAMVDLANAVGADPWICVPHRADDNYVQQMAALIQSRLAPGRKVYIEYSNEFWNGIFPQTGWMGQQGCAAGLNNVGPYPGACGTGGATFWAGIKFGARRAAQIFDIFERAFGAGSPRLVKVLAAQAGNRDVGDKLFESYHNAQINPLTGVKADALAVAPYFAGGLGDQVANQNPLPTVQQFLNLADADIDGTTKQFTRDNKTVADKWKVPLIAYEGGQHFVGNGANQNNAALTQLLTDANRDPRMRQLYAKMFHAWYQESGGGLFTHFTLISPFNKYGSWGALETQEQPITAAPKYQAVQDALATLQSGGLP